ncbi:polysaccharide deacetylase family protein [Aquisediminimonas profunda]|uniref:polysaccharide deacetylase family protein n=1 Tax=Aquisediminimonas profunda TaxID=1550733 RepID=UPI001C63B5DF|nr:polysaccharide deacetylase family protein [Aquisediminimonas profunda]
MSDVRSLLASIHDVTPVHARRLERLVPLVQEHVGVGRFALLAVPDFHGEGGIESDRGFAARLRGWSDDGCEVFLHGYLHRDSARHTGALSRLKANHLTAGEGEFLGLDHATALRLLADGRNRVEDVIGRPVAGFIAPAWLYGKAALQAIADLDFPVAEDHFRVWHPASGRVLARGPVITYASRTQMRMLSSLLWSRIATLALQPATTVRLGVHPHDLDAPELVREISRALGVLSQSHPPGQYANLLSHSASAKCGMRNAAASEPV